MKNPERIYLQDEMTECGRTWCEDQINEEDVPYVRGDLILTMKPKGEPDPRFPECEKVLKHRDEAQHIGAFLEWMGEKYPRGVRLPYKSTEDLLMEYFGVDSVAREKELQVMLAGVRKANEEEG